MSGVESSVLPRCHWFLGGATLSGSGFFLRHNQPSHSIPSLLFSASSTKQVVLLDHRLRAFWADLHRRLTAMQLRELASWYRAMIKTASHENAPIELPSYMV